MNKLEFIVSLLVIGVISFLSFNREVFGQDDVVQVFNYSYNGNYQTFTAPKKGKYKLEVWGAQGGGKRQISELGVGGKGGYSTGVVNLDKGDKLYIYVGGEGKSCVTSKCSVAGGFNGGGTGWKKTTTSYDPGSSGGGATDIRFISGTWNNVTSLKSRLIVAGGGGGGGMDGEAGGAGGGLTGITFDSTTGLGGTQNSGWKFGEGFSANSTNASLISSTYGGQGGGGGWYGGYYSKNKNYKGAGGGSGYVWTSSTSSSVPSGYSVSQKYFLEEAQTMAGNTSMPNQAGTGTMTGNSGNGYAKITQLRTELIHAENLELNSLNDEYSFETYLPSETFKTMITHDVENIIWELGTGEVTLTNGKTHEIILMNNAGEITIFTINPIRERALLNNVSFSGISFTFDKDVYNYTLNVANTVTSTTASISAPSGVTYTSLSNVSLKVGNNVVKIVASKSGAEGTEYTFNINRAFEATAEPIVKTFSYTGNYQSFTAPYTGDYTLEVWGAQGGGKTQNSELGIGGKGGYSKGTVTLSKGTTIYIYVGGKGNYCGGKVCTISGGYNGGGSGYKSKATSIDPASSGGGATDIRFTSGTWNNATSLKSRLIVAGGGGGGGMDGEPGGDGGGTSGTMPDTRTGNPGTQTSGFAFGYGVSITSSNYSSVASSGYGGQGGGGGWYGGYASNGSKWCGAGGGSGFVWTSSTKSNVPSGYSVSTSYYLKNAETKAGNVSMPNYAGTGTMTGNEGDGYAKISYADTTSLDAITSITSDKGTLTPNFSATTTEYNLTLGMNDVEFTLNASTSKGLGLITGIGTYPAPSGAKTYAINFTNTDGTVTIYNINVTKVANPSAIIAGFKVNGVLYDKFDENVTTYDIEIPTDMTKINLELIKKYPNQVVPTNNIYDFTESTLSKTLIVRSEGDLANQPYIFNFNRKRTSTLKSLNITGGALVENFESNKTTYTLNMTEDERVLDLNATPWFPEAVITKVEPRYVGINDKEVTIKVELDGVEPTIYTLNINRVPVVTENINNVYNYTGNYQTFVAPFTGDYTLEVWGARGGGKHQNSELGIGGAGGYSRGTVTLNKGDTLYIYVGGQGSYCGNNICSIAGGYNGGGSGYKSRKSNGDPAASGGGATDIRFVAGAWNNTASLNSRLIVAGGGGGGGMDGEAGGAGGGTTGYSYSTSYGVSGTQTSGGGFGYGVSVTSSNFGSVASSGYGGPGAGGGWYGGATRSWYGAGGGSGFVWTVATKKNVSSSYSVNEKYYLKDTETISGNNSMPNVAGNGFMSGNNNNGYAKITAVGGSKSDTFLDNIILNDGAIDIDFEPWTLEYNVTIDKDSPNLKIDAIAKDSTSIITGTGTYLFAPTTTPHNITVTGSDGTTKTYTINVTREPSDDPTPETINLTNNQAYLCGESSDFCVYDFKPETTTYEIAFPFDTKNISLQAVLRTNYQNVTYTLVKDTGEETLPNGNLELVYGVTTVKVEITSESGKFSTVYTYKLEKDARGNNNLASLKVTDPTGITIPFDPHIYEYNFTVASTITKVEVEAIPENSEATVKITGNDNLKKGMNEVFVLVTAPNGREKTYILKVFKEQSGNTFLSTLDVKTEFNEEVVLTPTFSKVLTSYNANVSSDVKKVIINATTEDENSNVVGTGTFDLKSGTNTFLLTVTSEKGDTDVYTITIVKARNGNSDLANLEIEGYTLDQPFDKNLKTYTLTIPSDVTSLNVKVTPEESTTTYTVRGNTSLLNKSNTIVITSIAEDKTYQVYEIIVNKVTSDNNYLKSLDITNGTLNETFDKETNEYTVDVDGTINQVTINGVAEDPKAKVTGNGVYALQKGENAFTVTVTSESGIDNIYTIKVNKALNNDVTLKEVTNNRGSIVTTIEDTSSPYQYLINVQYEVNNINIGGIPNALSSKVVGNGNYNLNPGDNDITLNVTAEDGSSKSYVVRVVRDKSTNDDLSFIYVHEGGIRPVFKETTIYYEVKVPNNTNIIHLEAVPEDKDSMVDVTNSTLDGSVYEIDISGLNAGDQKEIDIVVTAPKGNIKIYTVNIIKQEETTNNLALLSLSTNRGELIPTFNPNTLNYELTVSNSITDIMVSATAMESDVRLEGLGTYDLRVGKNLISVFVVGDDGVEQSYQIVVTREKSSDATLKNIVIKGHSFDPTFSSEVTEYLLTTSSDYLDFLTVTPTEEDATYIINGNKDLVNDSVVTITVMAPDGKTTKDYKIKITKEASNNNNLANLEVQGYTIIPKFHKGVTIYALEVPNNVNSVYIDATAEDSGATISGSGLKTINTGDNTFEIVVTSEAGTSKVYTVTITREASDNNNLASLMVSEGVLNPVFDKDTLNYEVTVPYTVDSIDITGTLEDANAFTNSFRNYKLNTGENNILIAVTSESGKVRNYSIKVIKEEIVSPYLINLEVANYELDTVFNKEIFEYYVTVDSEVTSLNLIPTLEDPKGSFVINGNENFVYGMNEVAITVMASDNVTTKDYTLFVNRQMSTNNFLSSLMTSEGTLNPIFDPKTLNYTLEVERSVESIEIEAITEDKSATITSGLGIHNLEVGENLINVKVKSAIGITRTYKVKVIRKPSDNNYLQTLTINSMVGDTISLVPDFKKDVNEYNVTVNSDINMIQIKGTPEDELSVVEGTGIKALISGLNTFEINVTSESGEVNTYTINITKEVSSNNYLTSLVPSVGEFTIDFDKETLRYTLNLDYTVSNLEFTAVPESNLATVKGLENQIIPEGISMRNITVTAEDGSIRVYEVTINKETASIALLENLIIDNYPFEFDPNTFTYNIAVSKSKKKLLESEITATPKDPDATVQMLGDLNLIDGAVNIYTIMVIAKDGYTTEEYTLNITRDSEDYTIRSDVYEIVRYEDETEEDYVIGIQPSTVISDFKNNFENDPQDLKVYLETTESDDSELTATALILKLEKDGYVYDRLRVIVRGDLTNDGKVNITDQVKLINYVGRTVTFNKYEMLAADLTFDGKVNITDQVKLINYVGRTVADLNKKPTS